MDARKQFILSSSLNIPLQVCLPYNLLSEHYLLSWYKGKLQLTLLSWLAEILNPIFTGPSLNSPGTLLHMHGAHTEKEKERGRGETLIDILRP